MAQVCAAPVQGVVLREPCAASSAWNSPTPGNRLVPTTPQSMPNTLPLRVRLAGYELNVKTGELRGGGQIVLLAEKPFRVLLILIEGGGELVTREEIQRKLWPGDTVVDFEHGINTAIRVLRRALGVNWKIPNTHEAPHRFRTSLPRNLEALVAQPVPLPAKSQFLSLVRSSTGLTHFMTAYQASARSGLRASTRTQKEHCKPWAAKHVSKKLMRGFESWHADIQPPYLQSENNIGARIPMVEHPHRLLSIQRAFLAIRGTLCSPTAESLSFTVLRRSLMQRSGSP